MELDSFLQWEYASFSNLDFKGILRNADKKVDMLFFPFDQMERNKFFWIER